MTLTINHNVFQNGKNYNCKVEYDPGEKQTFTEPSWPESIELLEIEGADLALEILQFPEMKDWKQRLENDLLKKAKREAFECECGARGPWNVSPIMAGESWNSRPLSEVSVSIPKSDILENQPWYKDRNGLTPVEFSIKVEDWYKKHVTRADARGMADPMPSIEEIQNAFNRCEKNKFALCAEEIDFEAGFEAIHALLTTRATTDQGEKS